AEQRRGCPHELVEAAARTLGGLGLPGSGSVPVPGDRRLAGVVAAEPAFGALKPADGSPRNGCCRGGRASRRARRRPARRNRGLFQGGPPVDASVLPPFLPCMIRAEQTHLRIPSRPDWIGPTAEFLQRKAVLCGACPGERGDRLLVALHEALSNAIIHGNLE